MNSPTQRRITGVRPMKPIKIDASADDYRERRFSTLLIENLGDLDIPELQRRQGGWRHDGWIVSFFSDHRKRLREVFGAPIFSYRGFCANECWLLQVGDGHVLVVSSGGGTIYESVTKGDFSDKPCPSCLGLGTDKDGTCPNCEGSGLNFRCKPQEDIPLDVRERELNRFFGWLAEQIEASPGEWGGQKIAEQRNPESQQESEK